MIETMNQKFYTAKNDKVFKAVMCDEDDRRILNTEKKLSFMEGQKQNQLETAKKMKDKGIDIETILEITSLSIKEIEKL